ncbi:MAG: hypothetical protein J5742_03740 [Alphaproteobacteria bacterium]|nr:hypothetical protein [Alphaproteobacteria bacterium]
MFKSKTNLTVVITVVNADALRLSLPPLNRIHQRFNLVIYNDNPELCIDRRKVKRIGWRGASYIINADKNYGELESRLNAIKQLQNMDIHTDWIVFVDQDDVLLDASVPDVSDNIFAVVQNATTLSEDITDIFKITPAWVNGCECGRTGPHFAITGTIIRTPIFAEFADFITNILPKLYRDLRHTRYRVPLDSLLWLALKGFVRVMHPDMSPIYMNRTNYVAMKMGFAPIKYGRRNPEGAPAHAAVDETVKRFLKTIESAVKILAQNA